MLRFILFGVASVTVSGHYSSASPEACSDGTRIKDPSKDSVALNSDGTVHVLFGFQEKTLHAVNNDGTAKWIFNASAAGLDGVYLSHREGPNGIVYVSGRSSHRPRPYRVGGISVRLLALDGSDGSVKWTYTSLITSDDRYTKTTFKPLDLVVAKDGSAYLSSTRASPGGTTVVEVIDVHGMLKWSFDTSNHSKYVIYPDTGVWFQRTKAAANGVNSESVDIQSLSLMDGSVKWTLPFPSYSILRCHAQTGFLGPLTFAEEDGSIFLIQDHTADPRSSRFEKSLLRLNGEDGSILWNTSMRFLDTDTSYTPYGQARAPVFFFFGNEQVYVNGVLGEDDVCNLGVFNVGNGDQRNLPCLDRSKYATDIILIPKLPTNGIAEDTFVITNQHFDVTWDEASVLAYSGVDGSALWNVSIDDLVYAHGTRMSLVVSQGKTFAMQGNHLHCIHQGRDAWNMTFDTSPADPVVAGDGTAFIGLFLHSLVAVASDGVEKWRYSPKEETFVI